MWRSVAHCHPSSPFASLQRPTTSLRPRRQVFPSFATLSKSGIFTSRRTSAEGRWVARLPMVLVRPHERPLPDMRRRVVCPCDMLVARRIRMEVQQTACRRLPPRTAARHLAILLERLLDQAARHVPRRSQAAGAALRNRGERTRPGVLYHIDLCYLLYAISFSYLDSIVLSPSS